MTKVCPLYIYLNCKNASRLCKTCIASTGKNYNYSPIDPNIKFPELEKHNKQIKVGKQNYKKGRAEEKRMAADLSKHVITKQTCNSGAVFGDADIVAAGSFHIDCKVRTGKSFSVPTKDVRTETNTDIWHLRVTDPDTGQEHTGYFVRPAVMHNLLAAYQELIRAVDKENSSECRE